VNGQRIHGANDSSYRAKVNGIYKVKVTDENGCSNFSDGVEVEVDYVPNNISEFRIYPNPAEAVFNIEGAFRPGDIIEINSLLGRRIFHKKIAGNTRKIIADISGNPSGVYLMRIISKDKAHTFKLIKY
jgi:hypothetical protein